MRIARHVLIGLMIGALAAVGLAPAPAGASGPSLRVPPSALAAALTCHGSAASGPTPVLLVPGTTLTASVNFS